MWLFSKKEAVPALVVVVEEFKIEEIETFGFKKLILRFQDSKGKVYPFEFHPGYAHALSDELVKAAARAMAPKT